jgi:hypothetical protein
MYLYTKDRICTLIKHYSFRAPAALELPPMEFGAALGPVLDMLDKSAGIYTGGCQLGARIRKHENFIGVAPRLYIYLGAEAEHTG